MQCILAVSTRMVRSDNTPLVVVNLSDQYPIMELQGIIPEVLKKIVTAYETVSSPLCLSQPENQSSSHSFSKCQSNWQYFYFVASLLMLGRSFL